MGKEAGCGVDEDEGDACTVDGEVSGAGWCGGEAPRNGGAAAWAVNVMRLLVVDDDGCAQSQCADRANGERQRRLVRGRSNGRNSEWPRHDGVAARCSQMQQTADEAGGRGSRDGGCDGWLGSWGAGELGQTQTQRAGIRDVELKYVGKAAFGIRLLGRVLALAGAGEPQTACMRR